MACCGWFFGIIAVLSLLVGLLKIYIKLTTGWCNSKKCLVGKTTLITGANIGLGYETARDFAMRGARVILACRDAKKAEDARRQIIQDTGNDNVIVKIVDMSSFESVRKFAKEINSTEKRLDILVNNAGIASGNEKEYSEEGNVYVYQVNYFSHFLLTLLLLDLLKKSKPSRIVNVSSEAAKGAAFDLNKIKEFPGFKAYHNSKLLQIFFTKELANKLGGSGVTVYSLHPGGVQTDIINKIQFQGFKQMLLSYLLKFASAILFKTTVEGIQTTLHLSLENGLENESGKHFSDCKVVEYPTAAVDSGLLKKVWEKSEQVVNLKPEENPI